ncbi:MAG: hypothetical protein M0025_04155, partial [Elusimicrobia bacterium]|nr:hypothetical protein [Elusimicrobiota bacterium]
MRKTLFCALLFSLLSPALAADLTVVESVPAETVYGSTLAARPQAVWPELISSAQRTLDLEQFYVAEQA